MAKGKGKKCPNCNKQTLINKGSYRKCTKCDFVSWGWNQKVEEVGKGRGKKCPNCEKLTFHEITRLESGDIVRRCATCDYSGIEPTKKSK